MQHDNSFERANRKPAVPEQVRGLSQLRLEYITSAAAGILNAIQRNPDLQIAETPPAEIASAPALSVVDTTPEAMAPNMHSRLRQNQPLQTASRAFVAPVPQLRAVTPVNPVDEIAQGQAAVDQALANSPHPLDDPSLAILQVGHFDNQSQQQRAA